GMQRQAVYICCLGKGAIRISESLEQRPCNPQCRFAVGSPNDCLNWQGSRQKRSLARSRVFTPFLCTPHDADHLVASIAARDRRRRTLQQFETSDGGVVLPRHRKLCGNGYPACLRSWLGFPGRNQHSQQPSFAFRHEWADVCRSERHYHRKDRRGSCCRPWKPQDGGSTELLEGFAAKRFRGV